jgi:hypothetical protein
MRGFAIFAFDRAPKVQEHHLRFSRIAPLHVSVLGPQTVSKKLGLPT